MNVLSVTNISKALKDENLFSDVSFGLENGEHVGLIGKNGAGKTTLLKVLSGQLPPDEGTVSVNKACEVGYLTQDVRFSAGCTLASFLREADNLKVQMLNKFESGQELPQDYLDEMERLGIWHLENNYKRFLEELGVSESLDASMAHLSGGTQKKASIARLLAMQTQILFLDEPTNHLDIPSIEWLETYLKNTSSAVILVTHDRYFLDEICSRIIEIDRQKAFFYEGGYWSFLQKREERISSLQKEQDRLATILRREMEWLKRGPKARTGKDSGRKQRIEEMKSKQEKVSLEEGTAFSSISRRMGKKILELKHISKKWGDKVILDNFSFEFLKGQRLGVIGPNGSGKSTLLDIMTSRTSADSGIVDTGVNTVFGYYDQKAQNLPLAKTPLEFISEIGEQIVLASDFTVTPARFLELFGFPTSFHRLPIEILSGGERRRLYLISRLVCNPNFLVLDEPTNDLDIDTLRRLEQYIIDFQGTVVSVSHDRAFLDRTCTELFVMPQAVRFEGDYSDYKAKALSKSSAPSSEAPQSAKQKTRDKAGLSFKEQKEFDTLTSEIERLEGEKAALESFFSSGQPDLSGQKTKDYNEVVNTLSQHYERWEDLASRA